jgi:hypothetical protein
VRSLGRDPWALAAVSFLAFGVPSCADEVDPIAGVSDRAGEAPLDARDDEGDPSAQEEQSAVRPDADADADANAEEEGEAPACDDHVAVDVAVPDESELAIDAGSTGTTAIDEASDESSPRDDDVVSTDDGGEAG